MAKHLLATSFTPFVEIATYGMQCCAPNSSEKSRCIPAIKLLYEVQQDQVRQLCAFSMICGVHPNASYQKPQVLAIVVQYLLPIHKENCTRRHSFDQYLMQASWDGTFDLWGCSSSTTGLIYYQSTKASLPLQWLLLSEP
jgi:hypothetical protein